MPRFRPTNILAVISLIVIRLIGIVEIWKRQIAYFEWTR